MNYMRDTIARLRARVAELELSQLGLLQPVACDYPIRDGQTTIGACEMAPGHDGEHMRRPEAKGGEGD